MPDRSLPATPPLGFVLHTGVPNTSESKPYFAATSDAAQRCLKDPRCIGLSAQRMFYGTPGFPTTVVGRPGEDVCFLRTNTA